MPPNPADTEVIFYNVPIKLSAPAPSEAWCKAFESAFLGAAEASSARGGAVTVHGDRIVFAGTNVEEIAGTHMKALMFALSVANRLQILNPVRVNAARDPDEKRAAEVKRKVGAAARKVRFES